MLWRVVTPSGVVRVAAHDAGAVTEALAPLYGSRLEVVVSPWRRESYDRIDEFWLLAEARGLLFSIGRGMAADGVVRVRVGVTFLTEELAHALAPVPDGPLSIDVLVRPFLGPGRP